MMSLTSRQHLIMQNFLIVDFMLLCKLFDREKKHAFSIIQIDLKTETLHEKCPNTEYFLVLIFRKYSDQKILRTWTLLKEKEVYSENSQITQMELFLKIVDGLPRLNIFSMRRCLTELNPLLKVAWRKGSLIF